jgi:hypothetical protein
MGQGLNGLVVPLDAKTLSMADGVINLNGKLRGGADSVTAAAE